MNKILAFFSLMLLASSCTPGSEEVYMHSLNGLWPQKATQKFEFEIKENQPPKNIIFVVRNNNDYPYSNLRVFSKIYPEGQSQAKTDTLNYLLAHPNGEWIGKGFGDTKEILFQYKIQHRFPKSGRYVIEVQHAMRRDTLRGIEDFGIKVESAKSQNGE